MPVGVNFKAASAKELTCEHSEPGRGSGEPTSTALVWVGRLFARTTSLPVPQRPPGHSWRPAWNGRVGITKAETAWTESVLRSLQ